MEDTSVIKQIIKEMKDEKRKKLILKEWHPFHGSAVYTSDQQPLPATKVLHHSPSSFVY